MKKILLLTLLSAFASPQSFARTASVELRDKAAKKLYRSLSVKPEDHDDIINKNLEIEGLKISCEYWVLDKQYSCNVEINE